MNHLGPNHRMTLRIYAVDHHGTVTAQRPRITVTTAEPPAFFGSPLNWPPCQCARATGRPCPEGGA